MGSRSAIRDIVPPSRGAAPRSGMRSRRPVEALREMTRRSAEWWRRSAGWGRRAAGWDIAPQAGDGAPRSGKPRRSLAASLRDPGCGSPRLYTSPPSCGGAPRACFGAKKEGSAGPRAPRDRFHLAAR
jgi:hypothetical protein